MYRVYMLQLYDKMYISDPTVLNTKELRKNIYDMCIGGMVDLSCKINLTSKQVKYALCKNSEPDSLEFLNLLYYALLYREYAADIDKFYEENNFSEKNYERIKFDFVIKGGKSTLRSKVNYKISEAIVNLFVGFDDDVKYINIDEFLWCLAMDTLGVPQDEWCDDGLIDKHLTHKQEVENIDLLLNGGCTPDGKYSDRLYKWMKENKWSEAKLLADTRGLCDYLYSDRASDIIALIEAILDSLQMLKLKPLFVIENRIYYSEKKTTLKIPMGVFAVVCDEEDERGVERQLPRGNALYGYTGELYSERLLKKDFINYVGCPILLKDGTDPMLYYDIEQTGYNDISTWFSQNVMLQDTKRYPKNKYEEGTLKYELYNAFLDSLNDVNHLIAEVQPCSQKEFDKAVNAVYKYIGGS